MEERKLYIIEERNLYNPVEVEGIIRAYNRFSDAIRYFQGGGIAFDVQSFENKAELRKAWDTYQQEVPENVRHRLIIDHDSEKWLK